MICICNPDMDQLQDGCFLRKLLISRTLDLSLDLVKGKENLVVIGAPQLHLHLMMMILQSFLEPGLTHKT
jgi:hypothetical protein